MSKGALCCVSGGKLENWRWLYLFLSHFLISSVSIETLTQSCFSCFTASSLGWPSFQAVNPVLQVASLVPIVPPVNVKLVPSENVYLPSVSLGRTAWCQLWNEKRHQRCMKGWGETCRQGLSRSRRRPRSSCCSASSAAQRFRSTLVQRAFQLEAVRELFGCILGGELEQIGQIGCFVVEIFWDIWLHSEEKLTFHFQPSWRRLHLHRSNQQCQNAPWGKEVLLCRYKTSQISLIFYSTDIKLLKTRFSTFQI